MTEDRRQELIKVLGKVRKTIRKIKSRNEKIGEQNTKAKLINPILSALGWDLEELDEVRLEYRKKPKDNPVDYALFIMRTPRLFIEAKSLEAKLDDRKWVSQTLGYATVVGVEWCVLTNGDNYRIYNSHAAVDVDEKLFLDFYVSDKSQEKTISNNLDLLSKDKMGENLIDVMWKAHFIDRQLKMVVEKIIAGDDKRFIRLIQKDIKSLKPLEIRESLKRADIQFQFPSVPALGGVSKATTTIKPHLKPKKSARTTKEPAKFNVKVVDLIQVGIITPPFKVEKTYKGVFLSAIIEKGGRVIFKEKIYNSLSVAGGMARNDVIGPPLNRPHHPTNGWLFWKYHESQTGKLEPFDFLRKRYLTKIKNDEGDS